MILQLSSQIGDVKVRTKASEVNVLDYCSPRSHSTHSSLRTSWRVSTADVLLAMLSPAKLVSRGINPSKSPSSSSLKRGSSLPSSEQEMPHFLKLFLTISGMTCPHACFIQARMVALGGGFRLPAFVLLNGPVIIHSS